jgi:hypothetical protein
MKAEIWPSTDTEQLKKRKPGLNVIISQTWLFLSKKKYLYCNDLALSSSYYDDLHTPERKLEET